MSGCQAVIGQASCRKEHLVSALPPATALQSGQSWFVLCLTRGRAGGMGSNGSVSSASELIRLSEGVCCREPVPGPGRLVPKPRPKPGEQGLRLPCMRLHFLGLCLCDELCLTLIQALPLVRGDSSLASFVLSWQPRDACAVTVQCGLSLCRSSALAAVTCRRTRRP